MFRCIDCNSLSETPECYWCLSKNTEETIKYLGCTFSPMMLSRFDGANVTEIGLDELPPMDEMISCISHENTAGILSALLKQKVNFNRVNISLEWGDELYCIIPGFRCNETREFTFDEVSNAGFRCFKIDIYR